MTIKPEPQTHTQTRVGTRAPQQAVQEYLDGLLQDATARARDEVVVPQPAVTQPAEPAPRVVEPRVPVVAAPVMAEPAVATGPEPEADGWINGRPRWAQSKFECLLFKVAGLTLAVPLVELGGVLNMSDELTPLFGQPDWFLGLLPSKTEGTVKAIDTARCVMPERYDPEAREGIKYVILMEGTDWGMSCHEVADAITLEPHQVSWRSDRGRRPWLAGTVVDHMCAIMDVSALVRLVNADSRGTPIASKR